MQAYKIFYKRTRSFTNFREVVQEVAKAYTKLLKRRRSCSSVQEVVQDYIIVFKRVTEKLFLGLYNIYILIGWILVAFHRKKIKLICRLSKEEIKHWFRDTRVSSSGFITIPCLKLRALYIFMNTICIQNCK